jgi:hypothetical protein
MPLHKPLVVDPSSWARGKETAENLGGYLFNQKTRKFDIMGWLIQSYCGYSSGDFGNQRIPSIFVRDVLGRGFHFPRPIEWLLTPEGLDSEDCKALIFLNDDITIDDETRKKHITELLAKHDVEIKFTEPKPTAPKQETLNLKPPKKDILNAIYSPSDERIRAYLIDHDPY